MESSHNKMEESARDRKRNSARKKSEFSVYSQKAVRAKEKCLDQLKKSGDKKKHLKNSK